MNVSRHTKRSFLAYIDMVEDFSNISIWAREKECPPCESKLSADAIEGLATLWQARVNVHIAVPNGVEIAG